MRFVLPAVALSLASGCIYSSETHTYTGGTLTLAITGSDVLPSTPLEAPGPEPSDQPQNECAGLSPPPAAAWMTVSRSMGWEPLPRSGSSLSSGACWSALEGWPQARADLSYDTYSSGSPGWDTGYNGDPDAPAWLGTAALLYFWDPTGRTSSRVQFAQPDITNTADPRGTYDGLDGLFFPTDCDSVDCAEPLQVTLGLNFADFDSPTY